ncbi:ATP-binding protein [Nocardioides palaemonis]|uniref:ATP-binding protein n=1 Tax=Nocardioides palaemonis TaxID=2829810 RepID=UPI0020121E66|nr:ATP-binding protein [Nocardioides palaemonis]
MSRNSQHLPDNTRSTSTLASAPSDPRRGDRLHVSVLVSPEGERRSTRKGRKAAAAALVTLDRDSRRFDRRTRADQLTAERKQTVILPRAGEARAAALRMPGRLRLPRHQDTSAILAGAYPFLAEGGLGSEGIFVGQDLYSGSSFVYDPWILYARGLITAPNVVLAGIVGSGKSSLAKSIYTRSLPFGRRVYVPGDPKGEHTAVAEAVGGRAIALGHGMPNRLNPLDEGHRPSGIDDDQWASQVASRRRDLIGALAETVLDRRLSPLEHTAVDIAIDHTVHGTDVPTLPAVVDHLLSPNRSKAGDDHHGHSDHSDQLAEDGRLVGHALRRLVAGDLAGLFDGPSTIRFDPTLPMISLDLSRVAENATLTSVLMTCASAWMESALQDPAGGQRWVIYDEAWRLMSHPALLRRMDAQWRMARHYGIANMLIFHKLTDLDNVGDQGSAMRALASSLLANAETRIVYRQESDQLGATSAALGLTGTEQSLIPTLGTGQGLWRIKHRSFVVQHQMHPDEQVLFDTTARMIGGQPHDHTHPLPHPLPNRARRPPRTSTERPHQRGVGTGDRR